MENVSEVTQGVSGDNLSFWGNIKHSLKAMGTSQYWIGLFNQLKGWHGAYYILFGFAAGLQLLTWVLNPITVLSTITMLSVLVGVLCICSISSAKSINGFAGLISAFGFIYVAFSAKNYLQIAEQLVYIFTLDLPVLLNVNWNKNMAGKISKLDLKGWVSSILGWLVLWGISAFLIGHLTNDPRPVIDALVFSMATLGGILTFLKKRENFLCWVAVGVTSLVLWYVTFKQGDATYAMLLSSLVYVINDGLGFTISPWFNKKARKVLAQQEAENQIML